MELKIIDGLMQTRAVNAEKRSVDAIMSTDALDRYNERIDHKAWTKRLARFQSSPVLLKDHDHGQPIGHWESVQVGKDGLTGTAIFAKTDTADERFTLHRDGHVKGFSVGFIPHKWSFKNEAVEGERKDIRVFEDVELIECSSVSIPANPDALQRVMRSVAFAWSDTPEELASFYQQISQAVGEQINTELDKHSQSIDARMAGWLADAIDLLQGRETHGRLFDEPGQRGSDDGTPGSDDTVSPETAKAIVALAAKHAPRN